MIEGRITNQILEFSSCLGNSRYSVLSIVQTTAFSQSVSWLTGNFDSC